MNRVFIGLGSNLDKPLSQIKKAVEQLKQLKSLNFINISNLYSSAPMGPQDQPDYINAVVEVSTSLAAEQLLDELQEIENKQGRVRSQHWGARTLDLDILLYGEEVINTERLTVPHSGISERNFVLYPLSDLVEPDFEIPTSGKISELVTACPMTGIKRLSEV
ncbi:MAG: 2-amino-4-hydroxy-6-hydroxymethyldihydropteridine diphosphokinase [Gammaproteobacteria bacterium]|nr:MAG: 2-amino-4-hydroxy-6-hydroxymethyldihydropteridine diphosphokinase [Gammaproteobacteria bacterium]